MQDSIMPSLARRALQGNLKFALIFGALIFATGGSLSYWQGWLLWFNVLAWSAALTLYLYKFDPALLERRMRGGPAAEREPAQKRIIRVFGVFLLAIFVVAGLDRHFGWSTVAPPVVIFGNVLIALGFMIVMLVMRANSFASATIEVAEGQTVISTGPYGLVRHPMYAGAAPMFVGLPLALGSWWALPMAVPIIAGLVARLREEEIFLARNLPGYDAYLRQVRYRLLPGVW